MESFHLYAANLFSLDCEKSALLYSRLFALTIITKSQKHSELCSESGFRIFIDSLSEHCNSNPGCVSFSISKLKLKELNLEPLQKESFHEKENYASFLDEYSNRIWIFEKDESKK